jgi:hypothetical protein
MSLVLTRRLRTNSGSSAFYKKKKHTHDINPDSNHICKNSQTYSGGGSGSSGSGGVGFGLGAFRRFGRFTLSLELCFALRLLRLAIVLQKFPRLF